MCTLHELLKEYQEPSHPIRDHCPQSIMSYKPLKMGENRSQSIASSHEQFKEPWTHIKYIQGIFSFRRSSYFVNIHCAGSSNGNSAQLRILPAGRQELRAGKNLVLTCRAQVCKVTKKRKGCKKNIVITTLYSSYGKNLVLTRRVDVQVNEVVCQDRQNFEVKIRNSELCLRSLKQMRP